MKYKVLYDLKVSPKTTTNRLGGILVAHRVRVGGVRRRDVGSATRGERTVFKLYLDDACLGKVNRAILF